MKKFIIRTTCIIGSIVLLASCGGKDSKNNITDSETISIGLVTAEGGIHDESFNQACWEGLSQFDGEPGYKVNYVESKQEADYQSNLDVLADAGNDLIFGVGFQMADIVLNTAISNPGNKYAIVDIGYGDATPDNLIGMTFRGEESAFLAGYIAGKTTETDKIGFIGAFDIPLINEWKYGFFAGAMYANPDAVFEVGYAGSFADVAKGRSMGNQMYMNGNDVIFGAAGFTSDGVVEAAKEQGKWVILTDRDQQHKAPDNILTSAIKHVDIAVSQLVRELKEGKFDGGTTKNYGVKEGVTGVAPLENKNVSMEIMNEVKEIESEIISGEIVIPTTEESYQIFLSNLK